MSKLNRKQIRKNSFLAPAVITATVAASTLLSSSANAETKKFNIQSDRSATNSDVVRSENSSKLVDQLQLRPNAVSQNVTSVSQLSDVRSTDWAFTALQSLVERYGVIAGYPDRTFRGRQALTELLALRRQQNRVNQHPRSFDALQNFGRGQLYAVVHIFQTRIALNLRPQGLVHMQRHVAVFAGVLSGFVDLHLCERNLVRAFAAQVFVTQTLPAQVAHRQALQAVGFVGFQHITFQERVVRITGYVDACVLQHMGVVLDVLPELGCGRIFKPRLQLVQNQIHRQLVGAARIVVSQRNVGGLARCDAE